MGGYSGWGRTTTSEFSKAQVYMERSNRWELWDASDPFHPPNNLLNPRTHTPTFTYMHTHINIYYPCIQLTHDL